MYLSMLSPRGGGGTLGICGVFDFSEEVLVQIPTVGPQNLVLEIRSNIPTLKMSSEKQSFVEKSKQMLTSTKSSRLSGL